MSAEPIAPIQNAAGLPFQDVCVACSTPPGSSGLAVIRLSGDGSPEVAEAVFRLPGGQQGHVRAMPGNTCRFGRIVSPADGSLIDEVVLTRFAAPRSYTGEDLVEISCHGGTAVKQAILDALLQSGARPAEPGEFSRRAFLNGKIDLSQAEAVMELISAAAGRSAAAAARQLEGGLMRLIRSHMDRLFGLMARTELILEFPEHEDLDSAAAGLAAGLSEAAAALMHLGDTFRQGRILHEGMTVVIAGRPNVGKSSLLNSLARRDRAIVTDIPGTTRDTIEELIDIDGIPVRLVDTAGLRDSADTVEQIGIGRARAAIESADLVFYLVSPPWGTASPDTGAADAGAPIRSTGAPSRSTGAPSRSTGAPGSADAAAAQAEIEEIRTIASLRPLLLLCGKADLPERAPFCAAVAAALPELPRQAVSTLTGEGQAEIRQAIAAAYQALGASGQEDIVLTSARHHGLVTAAAASLDQAAGALRAGIPLDVAATLLRTAADQLAEITGDSVSDTLVDTIFSRFCVGK